MAKNTKVQQFRDNATEEQWKELVNDKDILNKDEFKDKYGFAWNSILQDAAKRGYYEMKRHFSSSVNESSDIRSESRAGSNDLVIKDFPRGAKYVTRSFLIREDLAEKLQNLEEYYEYYSKKHIFNQLLQEAIDKYAISGSYKPVKEDKEPDSKIIPDEMDNEQIEENNEVTEDVEVNPEEGVYEPYSEEQSSM